jgi:hypothetical protein
LIGVTLCSAAPALMTSSEFGSVACSMIRPDLSLLQKKNTQERNRQRLRIFGWVVETGDIQFST